MKHAFISVTNDLATDQRVGRLAKLLTGQGIEVTCIGRKLKNSPELTKAPFRSKRFRMLFSRGPLFYACFNLRLLLYLLFVKKPALFISNDLDTLPANFLVSRCRRVPLIYDSHELFTQVPELINRKTVQSVWRWIEGYLIPRIEYAVTVSYSIATIYRRLYGTRFRVVRNVPERLEYTAPERDPEAKQVIIYQGALNVGRGLELMIDAMQYLPMFRFVIAGSGDIEDKLKQIVAMKDLGDRIEFKGRLFPDDLLELTRSADLGISLEEDLGLNYRYALPNKIFDYIQCRVPVLCSALPEMRRIVESYGVGMSTGERNPEKLAARIRYMLNERAGGAWRTALDRAAQELCWENESKSYLDLITKAGV